MTTATETMQTIRDHGQQVADDSPRTVGELSQGDHTAQGDVTFVRLDELPSNCDRVKNPDRQLAPGTTQGSRHCVRESDMCHVDFYELHNANPLQGPVLVLRQPATIEHPEHGDQSLGEGVWFVTYQRAFARELRRVQD